MQSLRSLLLLASSFTSLYSEHNSSNRRSTKHLFTLIFVSFTDETGHVKLEDTLDKIQKPEDTVTRNPVTLKPGKKYFIRTKVNN